MVSGREVGDLAKVMKWKALNYSMGDIDEGLDKERLCVAHGPRTRASQIHKLRLSLPFRISVLRLKLRWLSPGPTAMNPVQAVTTRTRQLIEELGVDLPVYQKSPMIICFHPVVLEIALVRLFPGAVLS